MVYREKSSEVWVLVRGSHVFAQVYNEQCRMLLLIYNLVYQELLQYQLYLTLLLFITRVTYQLYQGYGSSRKQFAKVPYTLRNRKLSSIRRTIYYSNQVISVPSTLDYLRSHYTSRVFISRVSSISRSIKAKGKGLR